MFRLVVRTWGKPLLMEDWQGCISLGRMEDGVVTFDSLRRGTPTQLLAGSMLNVQQTKSGASNRVQISVLFFRASDSHR
jgi:hypothetical protein